MEEVKKKNMVRETQISRGNYRKEVKVTEISAGVSINARGPINVEIESSKRPAWLSMIEGRENVNITEVRGESKGWDRKTRTLTPQAQMVIETAVTAATAGVGGAVGAGAVGSAIAAGVSGFASSMVVGTINNGGNVGKGLKSATSKESLRSLGKDMLTAGVITGVMNGTGFGDVAARAKDGGVAGRNQGIFERVLLRTTVNTAIKGGSLRDNFKSEALRGALAVGQGYIGDIGQRYGLSERGTAKVMMPSALGGTYALASKGNVAIGMLAGGMGEALSGLTSPESSAHAFSGTGEGDTGLSNLYIIR